MYRIVFTKSANRSLLRMPKDVVRRIRDRLEEVAADPYAMHPSVTKLQNRPGYRLRVGDWRVIYEVQDQEVAILVLAAGPRGDVYR